MVIPHRDGHLSATESHGESARPCTPMQRMGAQRMGAQRMGAQSLGLEAYMAEEASDDVSDEEFVMLPEAGRRPS
jgi:hypothetical protein